MTTFKFFFDANLFSTLEIAKANFHRYIAENEKFQRALKTGKKGLFEELYPSGGAQYVNGKWEVFEQINIYQNLDSSTSSGAENVIVECPICRKPALFRGGAITDRYIHVDGTYKMNQSDILFCVLPHEIGGMRDYSS